jgi:hypothetical protein
MGITRLITVGYDRFFGGYELASSIMKNEILLIHYEK